MFIPAGYLSIEKALVTTNVFFRTTCGCVDADSLRALEAAKRFYPLQLGLVSLTLFCAEERWPANHAVTDGREPR